MGLWSRLDAGWRGFKSAGANPDGSLALFREIYGRPPSRSGAVVNLDSALRTATFFACVRVKAEDIAQCPCDLFRDRPDGNGKDIAKDHPLYPLLTVQPNDTQTTFEFFETLVFHLEVAFNFYAFKSIVRGRIDELIPIEPHLVQVRRQRDLTLVYDVNIGGQVKTFPSDLIWHVRGPSWNGWQGMDFLKLAREALGLSIAIETDQAHLYKNGLRTSGTYSVEGTLNSAQYQELRAFIKEYQAAESGEPLILDRAAKYISETMKGVDAQTLEQRKHQVEEVCRLVRVMPIMIGHAGNTSPTFASAEQFFIAHRVHTLQPPSRRVETSIGKNLIGKDDTLKGVKAKFNLDSLQRGAFKDKIDAITKMLGSGGSTPMAEVNEVRELLDMNPVDWGKGKPEPAVAPKSNPNDKLPEG
ncbi:phage portal protein [Bradyrhizobium sp. P5_C12]